MAYVIYDPKTTAIIPEKSFSRGSFKTLAAAKAARTRMVRRQKFKPDTLAIAESNYYLSHIKKMVERTNLMTGKTYMEDVNTPRCCSPSSEAYWSM